MRLIRLLTILTSFILLTTSMTLVMSRRGVLENDWLIVFTRSFRNDWFLVTILPNGEAVERPTEMRGELVWSPDDEWVAYIDSSRLDQQPLYRVRPTGQNRELLLENASNMLGLSWSPDREWLYYYSTDNFSPNRLLFRLHIGDSSPWRFDLLADPYCCDWSADGEWMLADEGNRIVRARPDGTDVREMVSMDNFDVAYPQFAADERVVFSANQVPRINIIYQVDIESGAVEQISHTDYSFLPSVSPNGEEVVFLSTQLDTFLTHLVKIDLDDPQPQVLTELTDYYYEYNPFVPNLMWSPDGKFIMFLAQHEGQQSLFQVSAAGGAVETLYTVPNGKATRPHFLEFPHEPYHGWGFVGVSVCLLIGSLMSDFGRLS